MKCYNHPSTDAVGICKNCGKGICHDCIAEETNLIACKETCLEEARSLDSLIQRNKQAHTRSAGLLSRNAYFYGALGIIFIIFGYQSPRTYPFMQIFGALFLVFSVITFLSSAKMKKNTGVKNSP